MASVASPYYALHSTSQLKWTATQEKTLSREYPFTDLHAETPEQYLQRTYLQFLWLPESIMPLHLLVPSMVRVNVASSSQSVLTMPHPLHALLDQLLLSVRSSSNKYHIELPQILSDGGGAGEIEENMMWFALNYEKADGDEDRTRLNSVTHTEGPWVDEAWRKRWLERMERREIQIQILLHLLKISLPGPCPPGSELASGSPSKKRRHRKREPRVAVTTAEERLESFMDKLSTWQLLGSLSTIVPDQSTLRTSSCPVKEDRDWMQVFCEELVETQFKSKLPEPCALFRTKIFPNSPFSDDASSDSPSRSSSPMLVDNDPVPKSNAPQKHPKLSTASNSSRYPSPAIPMASTAHKHATEHSASSSFPRSRSRSLSVSLAQDADTRRAGSVGAGVVTKRRTLNREVSMSRVFKEKPVKKVDGGRAKLVSAEPKSQSQTDQGVTLVMATPIKGQRRAPLQPADLPPSTKISRSPTPSGVTNDIEEKDWSLPSSPDVLLLGGGGKAKDEALGKRPFGIAGRILASDTPVKKRRGLP